MLISKFVDVRITSNTLRYYRSLGYTQKCNTIITIPIEQLPLGSNIRVCVKCDNCGKEYDLLYCDYNKVRGNLYCKKCKYIKAKETNIREYGCENVFLNEEIRQKQKISVQKKYGCDNVFLNEEIKNKILNTNIQKYGADHPMRVLYIKEKVISSRNKTMYENGKCVCSRQLKHLFDLIGGELNKLYENFWLDIYFEELKIYVEWDGSGHDICVKYGQISEHDFRIKEIKRYKILKSSGLKEMRILCRSDIMPPDEVLLSMKDFGFCILEFKSHIVFDVDNNLISFDNNIIQYNFEKPIKYDIINNTIVTTVGDNIYYIDKNTV